MEPVLPRLRKAFHVSPISVAVVAKYFKVEGMYYVVLDQAPIVKHSIRLLIVGNSRSKFYDIIVYIVFLF
jgi:hypothetical protein